MDVKFTHYSLLEVEENASIDDIKTAYRKMALVYHPDRQPPGINPRVMKDVEDEFKSINEAYSILSDPQKKQIYDDGLRIRRAGKKAAPVHSSPPPTPQPKPPVTPKTGPTGAVPPTPSGSAAPASSPPSSSKTSLSSWIPSFWTVFWIGVVGLLIYNVAGRKYKQPKETPEQMAEREEGRQYGQRLLAEKDMDTNASPMGSLGPDAVWGGITDMYGPFMDGCRTTEGINTDQCMLGIMERTNATPQAINFARKYGGYMSEFEEHGIVDIAYVVNPFLANSNDNILLVNGTPDIVDVSDYELPPDLQGDPRLQQAFAKGASLWTNHLNRPVSIESGINGQSFRFDFSIRTCNGCESLAIARISYDFDSSGRFQGTELLEVIDPATHTALTTSPQKSSIGQKGKEVNFHYDVPQSGTQRHIRIMLVSKDGDKEIFNGLREPGAKIDIPVPYKGTEKVRIFINGILVEERNPVTEPKKINIHYNVPQNGSQRHIRIVAVSKDGNREIFNGLREPGSKIDVIVPKEGIEKFRLFINGILLEELKPHD
jgi:curved DNA-binding protein CbpA